MTIAITSTPRRSKAELYSGDRMSRAEFHRLYEQTPEDFKAELIGGIVYVAAPLKLKHATSHPWFSALLLAYLVATPGVQLGDNGTVILGDDSEVQPDLFLRVLPEAGGTTTTENDYVIGPPELIVEIAHSSRAIDLHSKRDEYHRYGVREYLVACVDDQQLRWFDFAAGGEMPVAADGIIRSKSFPGLWIDSVAVFARDFEKLMAVLNQGMATAEHAEFVKRLGVKG